jgi:NAD(P)-dependent dehydrogenase (short-subunit alcohol dehydrogenase family)
MNNKSRINLDEKTIAVIGAGSGIGEGVALGCAAHGARVVCLDLQGDAASATALQIKEHGGEAEDAEVNITDSDAVEERLTAITSSFGSLDGVVCTPAVNVRKPLLDYTADDFDMVINLNLKGTLNVLKTAGQIMKQQGSGSIVVFSSIRSLVVEPGQGVYAATKAGLLQMARTLAVELAPFGVRVNAIGPGVIETPLTEPIKSNPDWYAAYAARSALGRWGQPSEMAGPTVLLLSDAGSYMTGSIIYVDGGWTAIDGRFTPPGM